MLKEPTINELQAATKLAFEIQAVIKTVGNRCLDIAEREEEVDRHEISSFSAVADLCARLLDDVADVLDRATPLEERPPRRRNVAGGVA
ncbi:hypothetical protein E0H66_22965 [Rhizobium leguminosarum bv. viciae]|nr:hypothetical protein E0H66_22965 [Rhizobium leguminosarum bv. viciae]